MVKMKYDISVCGILRALYLVPIFRSVALSTNLFFVLGTVRVKFLLVLSTLSIRTSNQKINLPRLFYTNIYRPLYSSMTKVSFYLFCLFTGGRGVPVIPNFAIRCPTVPGVGGGGVSQALEF